MQFPTTILALTSLVTLSSASGVFSITGAGYANSTTSSVTLTVLNGETGAPATCTGTFASSALPVTGTIPCSTGFALSYYWNDLHNGIAATYTNPSVTFTYNVPNNGCAGETCQFGFTNVYPKKARGFKA